MHSPPRLLLLLAQSPFDWASGAAISMRHMAYLLARAGWQVRALSTNLTEAGTSRPTLPDTARHEQTTSPHDPRQRLLRVLDEGVEFELLECNPASARGWGAEVGALYDRHYDDLLIHFRPDVVLTFGGDPVDLHRRVRARAAGARVVFALHNLAYLRLGLEQYDHLLAPSTFLAQCYRAAGFNPVQVLPPPLWARDVLALEQQPLLFTFVNPERAKGAEIVARLAVRHPDLPFLVVESRARSGHFLAIARAAGIEVEQLENVMISPGMAQPRQIFAVTRALLMPSLVDEAAGRLAAEALANGLPALVSDAGGLPEMVGAGGMVLKFRRNTQGEPIIDDATIEAWSSAVTVMADADHYATAVKTAAKAGHIYHLDYQLKLYANWFASLLSGNLG